jgi:hypothetical protein
MPLEKASALNLLSSVQRMRTVARFRSANREHAIRDAANSL